MHCKSRIMMFYRWIGKILVVSTVVAFCIKLSLNSTVLKSSYAIDFRNRKWPFLAGNNSNRNSQGNTVHTFSLNMLHGGNNYKPEKGLQTVTAGIETEEEAAVVTETTTIDFRNIPNPFNTKGTDTKGDFKYSGKPDTKVKGSSKTQELRANYTNSTLSKKHPNQMDYEIISSGKYIPENLMDQKPFQFLKQYKNPCWKNIRRSTRDPPIRCLPYFYLIGAPKSGTTDLQRRLIKHPDISKLVVKEPHWLTRRHYYGHRNKAGQSNLTNYIRFFDFAARDIYMNKDEAGYHSKICGDCSASTMWDNDYWTILPEYRNLSEPRYTNADIIHHLNPNTKIIAMLRNPIDRLYSDYLFFQHGNPELFHEGVVKMIKETTDCLKKYTLRHCFYVPSKYRTGVEIRMRIGVYHLHLKEYLRLFPRDQVMVIKLEDFSNKTASYMQKIFRFLGVSELNDNDLQKIANPEQHANSRRKKDKSAGDMLPETRKLLQEFYRPHNERLTELYGELFNYNKVIS